jgi:hypothetical protein
MKLEELKRKVAQQKGWAITNKGTGKVLSVWPSRDEARGNQADPTLTRIVRVEYRVPGQRA